MKDKAKILLVRCINDIADVFAFLAFIWSLPFLAPAYAISKFADWVNWKIHKEG